MAQEKTGEIQAQIHKQFEMKNRENKMQKKKKINGDLWDLVQP